MTSEDEAVAEAAATGYPVLLKATGGGGGIGIYTCPDEEAVRKNFAAAGRFALSHACTCRHAPLPALYAAQLVLVPSASLPVNYRMSRCCGCAVAVHVPMGRCRQRSAEVKHRHE